MSATVSSGKEKKHGTLRWFGLLFLLPGLAVLVLGPLIRIYEHLNSADWIQLPVTLYSINVESHRGDDGNTYSVNASYSYHYQGQSYTRSRVGYDSGSDNISDYHNQLVRRINNQRARGSVSAWINPEAPHESYLVRDLRWKKMAFMGLFGLLFSVVGLAVMLSSRLRSRETVAGRELIFSSERHGHWLWAFMAFMFIGISAPAMLAIADEIKKENWLVLVALLFPLAGIWMAWMGWKTRRDWKFYGPLPLALEPFPGQLGGDIAGTFTVSRWYPETVWRVTLQCVRVRISKGKNRSRHESMVWQKEQIAHARASGHGALLQFLFTPPVELPETDDLGRNKVEWRLLLTGPKMPVVLERNYEIPVEQGVGKAVQPLPQEHVERSERSMMQEATSAAAEQIDVLQSGGGLQLLSRAGRNRGMTVMLIFAGLIFAGISVGLAIAAASKGFMLYVMAFIFGLFGFPMFIGGIFTAGRSLRVRVSGEQAEMIRYWAGFALWRRSAALTRASQLVLSSAGSVNSGNRMTEYFHLEVKEEGQVTSAGKLRGTGKKVRLAEGLAGREVAEAFRENVIRLLRLS